jgi:radical SAM family uncharacterized protein
MFSYKNFYTYQEPVTYMGIEPNFEKKTFSSSSHKILFIYPDVYSVAFSSFTFRLIFDFLHHETDSLVDFICYPQLDLARDIQDKKIDYLSHFYHLPLSEFDVIVTTINYELQFLNFLKMLQLLGVWEKGRGLPQDINVRPLVLIGGSVAFSNPALFLQGSDIIYAGEIEVNGREIFSLLATLKDDKEKLLNELQKFKELIIPQFLEWKETKKGIEYSKTYQRSFVENFDKNGYQPQRWIIPVNKIIHDKVYLEVMRGCTQGCRFCQAGFIYRPRREKSVEEIVKYAEEYINQTGYEELSLLSLSTNSYTQIIPLLEKLYKKLRKKHVNISLPSLRIDEFKGILKEYISTQRKSSITFAPEAGNEKMRRIINKKITDAEIFQGVEEALRGGWKKIKLYFMVGFPSEEDEDVRDIGRLIKEVFYFGRKIKPSFQVNVSVNLFIPKPFTPFQKIPLLRREEFDYKIKLILSEIKRIKKIKFDWSDYDFSLLEALLSRAHPDIYPFLVTYIENAWGIFTWREYFDFETWNNNFTNNGLDCYNFYKSYEEKILSAERFPWDLLDIGIEKEFLDLEYAKALKGEETSDCFKEGECSGCGLMSYCF